MRDVQWEALLRRWQQERKDDVNPVDYQKLAMRTLCDQSKAWNRMGDIVEEDNGMDAVQAVHATIGLQGEAGELASVMQKWLWYGKSFTLDELKQKIKDEAGDVLWYIAELLSAFGLNIGDVMQANIAKLKVRYPDKYADALAADEARDRLAEAAAVAKAGGHAVAHAGSAAIGTMSVIEREPIKFTEEMRREPSFGGIGECPHVWTLNQGVAGSGRKCKLCGLTEGF